MLFLRSKIVSSLWVILALLIPLSAWAADDAGGDQSGLPQFNTSLFPEQIFWLAITFGVLYLLMSRVALPRVAQTQENRQHVIASEIDAARSANDAAKAAVAVVEKSLTDARAKAQVSVSEMMAKVNQDASQRQIAQDKELLRHLRRAEEEIAVTREAALYAISASATDLGSTIVDKILHTKGRG